MTIWKVIFTKIDDEFEEITKHFLTDNRSLAELHVIIQEHIPEGCLIYRIEAVAEGID